MPLSGLTESLLLNSTMLGGPVAAVTGIALTFIGATDDTSNATVYTFTDASIGTASADRIVVVLAHSEPTGGTTQQLSTLTIGGTNATAIIQPGYNRSASISYLKVTSGTTATIVATYSFSATRCRVSVWTITGQTSDAPADSDFATSDGTPGTSAVVTLDYPAASVGVIALTLDNGASAVGWTNATEQYDDNLESGGTRVAAAYDAQSSIQTGRVVTASFASNNYGIAGAVWS